LAWHDLSPVNISVLSASRSFISRIDVIIGILLFGTSYHKEESQCEEVDKLHNADETEAYKQPTDATEVT
jgi:hypothetical protein